MTTVTAERITFGSEGVELVGDLRLAGTGGRRPAVAAAGSTRTARGNWPTSEPR